MMCYQGCRYEVGYGCGGGECGLPGGKMPPIDAMCSINELQAENTELRELVRDMINGMCHAYGCSDCEHFERYEGQKPAGMCEYCRRMRELGIEVNR